MIDVDRERFLAWACLPVHRRRIDRACQYVIDWLTQCQQPYVAFSGGKDSTVVLHLVREQVSSVPALMGYDDWLLPETVEFISSIPNLTRIAARIWHSDGYTSWNQSCPDDPGIVWFEAVHNSRVAPYARSQGYDGCALGLRKEEAGYRRWHLACRGMLAFCDTHQAWECNPIADWTVSDVWAYLLSRGISYNSTYDRLSSLGLPPEKQRVGPLAVERVLQFGQVSILKRGWPDLWNRFVAEHPEIRAYV